MDASETAVRAIFSQRFGEKPKLFPVTFFFGKLTAAECNHIGNQELLVVKLALEKLRHWLKGSLQTFMVLTYHKNLEYLQTAKRQARWALFFTCFNFTIYYRPEYKNTKAYALSRIHTDYSHSVKFKGKTNGLVPFIPWAEYAQNLLRYLATNLTPCQCVLGYQLLMFP